MRNFDIKLTKTDYENMVALNHSERNHYLEDNVLSMAIVCGYGFYGHTNLREENGEYLVNITAGSTCD